MNDKKFDSFIKKSLDGHDSYVPSDMWKRIQAEKDFDPFIKQSLDNHNSPVPTDMWERIQSQKKKERRPIIWWWAAAALFLLLGTATVLYFGNTNSIFNNPKVVKKIITPSANDVQATTTSVPNIKSSPITKTSSQDLTRKDTTNVAVTVLPNLQKKESNNGALIKPDADEDNTKKYKNQSSTHQISNSKTANNNKKTNRVDIGTQSENNISSANKKEKEQWQKYNSSTLTNTRNSSANIKKNGIKTLIPQKSTDEELEGLTLNSSNTFNNNEKILLLHQLIRSSFAKEKMMPKQLLHANVKNTVIACPPLGRSGRNDWYIEAFVSPDLVLKTLQDKPFGKNIQSGMDSTLHRQISFSAGVNIIKSLGENWLVKTGVQYAQINELFKYTNINEIRTTTVITVRNVIVSPGDTLFIRDTSTVQTIGSITKQTQNRYRQWDIPLIFSYEFGGQDLRLNANFGVVANIRSSYQGNMLDTLQKAIDISNYGNTGIYKTNIGLGVYLGLGILKPITDKIDLLVEPHARFNLSNMTTNAAIFNQQNTILGLSVGIRYKLNGKGQR